MNGSPGAGSTAPLPTVPTSLFTDHYELTMVAAALADGAADRRCTFGVFARRLPDGRRYGVGAGGGRVAVGAPPLPGGAPRPGGVAGGRGGPPPGWGPGPPPPS